MSWWLHNLSLGLETILTKKPALQTGVVEFEKYGRWPKIRSLRFRPSKVLLWATTNCEQCMRVTLHFVDWKCDNLPKNGDKTHKNNNCWVKVEQRWTVSCETTATCWTFDTENRKRTLEFAHRTGFNRSGETECIFGDWRRYVTPLLWKMLLSCIMGNVGTCFWKLKPY